MKILNVRNVHEALPVGIDLLLREGIQSDSRNGPVTVMPCPVTTAYARPTERVMFWPERDANPFFHLFESLWMLDGRNDVETVARWVARMRSYSDDGLRLHGAYGHRWRVHFSRDQLDEAVTHLREDPASRRCVIQMWDAKVDLNRQGKDLPCNTQLYVWIDPAGKLAMTVMARSNDIIWGAYGANAVHMSMLQEYLATRLGRRVGTLYQLSNNYHAYNTVLEPLKGLRAMVAYPSLPGPPFFHPCFYDAAVVAPSPLFAPEEHDAWEDDLSFFLSGEPVLRYHTWWFRTVLAPLAEAHRIYKDDPSAIDKALVVVNSCQASDWRLACQQWLSRRRAARENAA